MTNKKRYRNGSWLSYEKYLANLGAGDMLRDGWDLRNPQRTAWDSLQTTEESQDNPDEWENVLPSDNHD